MGRRRAVSARRPSRGWARASSSTTRGTILTNNHVVAGADEVQVVTSDGRVLPAKVEGSDPGTDVAVVRLTKPPGNLKVAKLGNSDKVRVGDYVLAIGNPLGLGQTVTMGIVSAKNRTIDGLIDCRTSSRPTPPSTRATRADRCSTSTARWSASTPPSSTRPGP